MESLGQRRQQVLLDALAEVRRAVTEVPDELPTPPSRVPRPTA
jgi:hypothetical protein